MGVVWGADDVDLHRPVALKVLSKETLAREDMRARFMREARMAAALNHPSICTIYEVGEVDEVPFIAMERIEGKGLDARLGEVEPLALKELVRIAVKVAEGLAAAHGQGIVHRDLKPGNVMLTEDGQVKILDFGLAKPQGPLLGGENDETLAASITAEMTQEGTILGTVAFMSPEQAQGKVVDSRSDVFSFGVLLYQMATGQMPFRGETTTSTLAKILERDPEAPSLVREGLPADLERIILRCLAKEPANRYNDTRDLVADLRSLQTTDESQAVTSTAASVVEPVSAPAPVEKPKRWLGLLALLLPVAAILFFFSRSWFGGAEDDLTPPPAAEVSAVPSVAVLPFHNMSAEAENDYFSDGMTEEIISKLSRIEGLEVASRSSVAAYTDRARDVQQIGSELGVRYLLDGSVRRAGEQIRVSAQLVDAETGRNVWSEDFDGSLEDIFAMQEQTALKIAERLNLELSPEEQQGVQKRATENVAAYDSYLRGMALSREWGNRARLEQSIEYFEEALERDPEYAAALAGLAFVESDMYRNFDTSEERIVKAEEYAQRAVELDPTMPDAPHALGLIAGNRFDYQRAADLLREAVKLAPKEARYWDNLSWALAYMTPPDGQASVDAAWEAIKLQPHFPGAYYHLGRGLLAMGRNEEARQAFETMTEQDPDFGARIIAMTQYYLAAGDYQAALQEIERDAARDTIMVGFYRASALARLGRFDEALEGLEHILDQGFRDFVTLEASPHFADLREDSRFTELIDKYRE